MRYFSRSQESFDMSWLFGFGVVLAGLEELLWIFKRLEQCVWRS
jgi:hypothetical protein